MAKRERNTATTWDTPECPACGRKLDLASCLWPNEGDATLEMCECGVQFTAVYKLVPQWTTHVVIAAEQAQTFRKQLERISPDTRWDVKIEPEEWVEGHELVGRCKDTGYVVKWDPRDWIDYQWTVEHEWYDSDPGNGSTLDEAIKDLRANILDDAERAAGEIRLLDEVDNEREPKEGEDTPT